MPEKMQFPPPPPTVADGDVIVPGVPDQPGPWGTIMERQRLRALALEKARRACEALKLYESLPKLHSFHASDAKIRVIRGSNRSSKTVSSAAEIARAVTGTDPYHKYPTENGRVFCVAKDQREIGQVMYRKMFRAGAFRIIRDETWPHPWRAFRPWVKSDLERESEAKSAPPLIPPRFVKHISWENKGASVPNIITLHNGWELSFFSSLAKPPHGADIDLAWFDEEIIDPDWLPEMTARLVDRNGRLIWSATPQAGTEQLFSLSETAAEETTKERPIVVEWHTLLEDNRYLTKRQKQEFAATLQTDEERRVRILGEFALMSHLVYPEYHKATHNVPFFNVPADWARYMVVDPGIQVCAVLFAAIPPNEKHVYLYDELYLENVNATMFGREVARHVEGQTFQAFLIDSHAGRSSDIGSGLTREYQYSQALKDNAVSSARSGHGFLWASDDVKGGILAVRAWLRIREDGFPKLRVIRDRLPNFEREIRLYHHKRKSTGEITDDIVQRNNHQMDNLRYLAMHEPKWYPPQKPKKAESWAVKQLRLKNERKRAKYGRDYISLGPRGGGPSF